MNTIKRITLVATLGVLLSLATGSTASAQYENLVANVQVTAISNPCAAGDCRVTVKDASGYYDEFGNPMMGPSWTVEFDCRNEAHFPGFVSDSGVLPAGSSFTCFYGQASDAGSRTIKMRVVEAGKQAGTSIVVANNDEAPGSIELAGPSSTHLPNTFEVVTSKRQADFSCQETSGKPCESIPVRSETRSGMTHWFVQVPVVTPGQNVNLTVEAWNNNPEFADRKVLSINVEGNAIDPFGLNPELKPYWSFLKKGNKCFISRTFGYYTTKPSKWQLKLRVKTDGKSVKPYSTSGSGGGSNFQEVARPAGRGLKMSKASLPAKVKVLETVEVGGQTVHNRKAATRLRKCKTSAPPEAAEAFGIA